MPTPTAGTCQRLDAGKLYRLYGRSLQHAVSMRVRTSVQNIEDACSFAWTVLIERQPPLQNAPGWLYTVATREAVKLHDAAKRTHPIPHDARGEPIELPDPANAIAAREQLLAAQFVLDAASLTGRQRRMLALQAIGLTYTEVSERTGCTVRTVERQLSPARRRLHENQTD